MFSSMRIDPQLAGPLRLSGISHVSLANNHSKDHGRPAFQESRNYLDAQQMVAMEHFWQAGKVYEIFNEGISIGLIALNFVDKTMGRKDESISVGMADLPAMLELITEHKQRFNHLVITVHWGDNYGLWPNNMQLDLAKQLAAAGASAVIGHHPHNIQAVNTIDSVPIVYSLGSFCFENKSPFTRLGQIIVLQCTENDLTITDHRHISIDRNYRISESLSPIQRLVVLLARSRPSELVNFVYVRIVRLWIFSVSLYRVVTSGNLGRYLRWLRYRYAKKQS
jgi:poly-gamma-glutamate synthesis protein (capsule biosynthesis protein)